MGKPIMIALSNPVSPERDEEFNNWYNNVHGPEVGNLAGFENMTRYRAAVQVVPPGVEPSYRYLALYELSDVDTAVRSLAEGADKFDMSDAVDLAGSTGIAFEQIFTTKAD